jgi:hypothetical protein
MPIIEDERSFKVKDSYWFAENGILC